MGPNADLTLAQQLLTVSSAAVQFDTFNTFLKSIQQKHGSCRGKQHPRPAKI